MTRPDQQVGSITVSIPQNKIQDWEMRMGLAIMDEDHDGHVDGESVLLEIVEHCGLDHIALGFREMDKSYD